MPIPRSLGINRGGLDAGNVLRQADHQRRSEMLRLFHQYPGATADGAEAETPEHTAAYNTDAAPRRPARFHEKAPSQSSQTSDDARLARPWWAVQGGANRSSMAGTIHREQNSNGGALGDRGHD
jgi:hypothetical protein